SLSAHFLGSRSYLRRIARLEIRWADSTDHRRRHPGFPLSPDQGAFPDPVVAARAPSPLFFRGHWPALVLRLRYGAPAHSRREAEARVQSPSEISIERKIQ